MKKSSHAGRVRQALREATMANHQRVDELFSLFSLDTPASYGAFLKAHARAVAPLEALARPRSPRLSKLVEDLASMGFAQPEPLFVLDGGSEAFRWGALYALEGSRLGGAMLERQVPAGLPRAYLSAAHGKGGWVAFQQSLDEAAERGGENWVEEAIEGAKAAFAVFAAAAQTEQVNAHG